MSKTRAPRSEGLIAQAMMSTSNSTPSKPVNSGTTATKRKQFDEIIDLTEDDDQNAPACALQTPKRVRTNVDLAAPRKPVSTPASKLAIATESNAKLQSLMSPLDSTPSSTNLVTSSHGQTETVDDSRQLITPDSPIEIASPAQEDSTQQVASQRPQQVPPIPEPTPQKKKLELKDMPDLADRYLAKTSTAEGIEYTNPQKFCVKPGYWKKWFPKQYVLFAEHLRLQFDPLPLAKATGLPVEEINHVFSAVVCNPLYDAEEATRRGEEGIFLMMELFNKRGTTSRPWGKLNKEGKQKEGELHGVGKGSVELILDDGSKGRLKVDELSEFDVEYLKQTLTVEDKQKLWSSIETEKDL